MCPGSTRANGARNPQYMSTFAFTNDFAALQPDTPHETREIAGLMHACGEPGICRVLCFSPRHDLTIARMDLQAVAAVVDLWIDERRIMAAHPAINYVQIFENRGAMMGASNPHPHGQIWASASVPNELRKEQRCQREHFDATGRDLLGAYVEAETAERARTVYANDSFVALVPFWAIWPFETLIVPRRQVATIDRFDAAQRADLAQLLKRLLTRYDNLFAMPCPYSMGFHEAPADGPDYPDWRWHAHVYPPLLPSATIFKFMVGYELLAAPQRDIPPELAAERLRALPETHQ